VVEDQSGTRPAGKVVSLKDRKAAITGRGAQQATG
jgi:hypothetical protein